MKYHDVVEGRFISRPNRFIANVWVDGKKCVSHVRNTGRCRELLIRGAVVYLEKSNNANRKTKYSLISVRKGERFVNIDSQAPNKVFREALIKGIIQLPGFHSITEIKPEVKVGESRLDYYIENADKKAYIEVKGVTLEEDGVAKFPDAPTERGVKHIRELIRIKRAGYEAGIIFVIQMDKIKYIMPNYSTHPAFGEALQIAYNHGVKIWAYECCVKPNCIDINGIQCEVVLSPVKKP